MNEEDRKVVRRVIKEFGDSFWREEGNEFLFDEIVEMLNKAGYDLQLVERKPMSWVHKYCQWLKSAYCDDDDEVEEIIREAVKVVLEMTELMPGLHKVLNEMTVDDMVMFDGFWRIADNWLDLTEKQYGWKRWLK